MARWLAESWTDDHTSTSVPGMMAKPIIDSDIVISSRDLRFADCFRAREHTTTAADRR